MTTCALKLFEAPIRRKRKELEDECGLLVKLSVNESWHTELVAMVPDLVYLPTVDRTKQAYNRLFILRQSLHHPSQERYWGVFAGTLSCLAMIEHLQLCRGAVERFEREPRPSGLR